MSAIFYWQTKLCNKLYIFVKKKEKKNVQKLHKLLVEIDERPVLWNIVKRFLT